ncbi:MAG: hypothetical protein WCX63_09990 [Methanoregula sp.]
MQNIVLIGGWAVDAYNPYFGSVDIDLVTDDRIRESLIAFLTIREGYTPRIHYPVNTVEKVTPHGEIILDFIPRKTPYLYEGHGEIPFTLDILTGNTVFRNVRGGAGIQVPNRSVLVLLKMKAAWDRTYRILHQTTADMRWEGTKRIKDCADILALIDPRHGGREVDLEILGREISRAGFLMEIIEQIPDLDAVRDRYRRMDGQEIRRVCEDFVSLL